MSSDSPNSQSWTFLFLAWLVAMVATMGSLFFSEVMLYPPCVLCWYQRICMYPLAAIFVVALFPADRAAIKFTLPLSITGAAIAFYHNLLYYKLIPESAAPCTRGVSCTSVHLEWLGFITIPLLSLTAFILILILQYLTMRTIKHEK